MSFRRFDRGERSRTGTRSAKRWRNSARVLSDVPSPNDASSFRVVDASTSTTALSLESTTSGQIAADAPGRPFVGEIDVPHGQLLSIGWSSVSDTRLRWSIEDPRGQSILENQLLIGTKTIALQAGTHMLRVVGGISGGEGVTGTFDLTLEDAGISTFSPTGSATTLGSELSGSVDAGTENSYVFPASAGDKAYFVRIK